MFLKIITFYFIIFNLSASFSQIQSDYIIVSGIGLSGNNKTKSRIILRELDISIGDTIYLDTVNEVLLKNKNKITNLDLFLNVDLKFENISNQMADLKIIVAEQNFIFPYPIIQLADRSFNEWWYNRHHDLKRIVYGVNFVHFNIGGRAEELWIDLENGFSKKIAVIYKIPYLNSTMKTGLDFDIRYQTTKQLAYRTNNDKLVFEDYSKALLNRFSTRIVLKRRKSFYGRQRLELSYYHEKIDDAIAILNPNYFLFKKTKVDYLKTSYEYIYDHRDNFIYPSIGNYFGSKISFVNYLEKEKYFQFELSSSFAYFAKIGKKIYGDINFRTKISSPNLQAWATTSAFGYRNEFVRGYDLYVIDGQKTALFKGNFRRELINTTIKLPKGKIWKNSPNPPLNIYGKIFYDAGYVWNKYPDWNNSKLANTYIYGYGLGIDVVSIYSGALKFNYSLNKRKESGLFISYGREF